MVKGCGLALVLLTGLVGGYMYWFDLYFNRPEALIFGAVAGLIVFFCVGALENAWRAFSDWTLVSRAQFGSPLYDGQKTAVVGRIRPEGEPLAAPFSGTPCVICEYAISRPPVSTSGKAKETSGSDYAGFLMTPAKIDTTSGEVRLLGYPSLDQVPEQNILSREGIANARRFLHETNFEDRSGFKLLSLMSIFGELWSDEDGKVEKHLSLRNIPAEEILPLGLENDFPPQAEFDATNAGGDLFDEDQAEDEDLHEAATAYSLSLKLIEKRVDVGEAVVVFGIYDEAHRGLLPPSGTLTPNRLLLGSGEEVEARLRSSMLSYSIGGLLFLILVHAAFYFALQLPEARKPIPAQQKAAWQGQLVGVVQPSLL